MKHFLAILLTLASLSVHATDLAIATTSIFVPGEKPTAAKINSLVNDATIQAAFYTDSSRPFVTTMAGADIFMICRSPLGYRRVTADNLILNNTNWYLTRVAKTTLDTNDLIMIYDSAGTVLKTITAPLLGSALTLNSGLATNWQNIFYLGPTNATYPTNTILENTNIVAADRIWIYDSVTTSNRSVQYGTIITNYTTNLALTILTNYARLDFGKNLLIYNTGTTTNAFTLTADELPLRNTNGTYLLPKNVSLTNININIMGTNGLDAGSRTTNTWYYIYAISDGTNVFGLLSTNPTSPVLVTNAPTYPFCSRQLGAVWQATNTFITTYQSGQDVLITPTNIISIGPIPSAGSYVALPAANAATFITAVPPIAKSINGTLFSSAVAASGGFFIAANAAGFSPAQVVDPIAGAATASITWAQFKIQLTTTTNIFWKGATGTSGSNQITISGYGL